MVSTEVMRKARKSLQIDLRYDKQELRRVGGVMKNIRKDWTPNQKRRMKKNRRRNGLPIYN